MWKAEVRGFLGRNVEVFGAAGNREPIAELIKVGIGGRATLVLGSRRLQMRRCGFFSRKLELLSGDRVVATAEAHGFRRRYRVRKGRLSLEFARVGFTSRRWEAHEGERRRARIEAHGFTSRRFEIDKHESVPDEVALFLLALTVRELRRRRAAAAS